MGVVAFGEAPKSVAVSALGLVFIGTGLVGLGRAQRQPAIDAFQPTAVGRVGHGIGDAAGFSQAVTADADSPTAPLARGFQRSLSPPPNLRRSGSSVRVVQQRGTGSGSADMEANAGLLRGDESGENDPALSGGGGVGKLSSPAAMQRFWLGLSAAVAVGILVRGRRSS